MTAEEFLTLIKNISYEEEDNDDELKRQEERAEKIKESHIYDKIIDLTNVKKEMWKDMIKDAKGIIIDPFHIKILRHKAIKNKERIMISLYEKKDKTPNGFPCSLQCAVSPHKDKRFRQCSWINHYPMVTEEEILDVILWLRSINKLKSFM